MKVSRKKKPNNVRRFSIHEPADVIREKGSINKVDGVRCYPVYFLCGLTWQCYSLYRNVFQFKLRLVCS